MAEKIIQKPKDWPVNPYLYPGQKTMSLFLAKMLVPIMCQIVEERDQQILREIKKQSQLNHNPWWSNVIKYPRVPFDPFFYTIMKRDKQLKIYLGKKYEQK